MFHLKIVYFYQVTKKTTFYVKRLLCQITLCQTALPAAAAENCVDRKMHHYCSTDSTPNRSLDSHTPLHSLCLVENINQVFPRFPTQFSIAEIPSFVLYEHHHHHHQPEPRKEARKWISNESLNDLKPKR